MPAIDAFSSAPQLTLLLAVAAVFVLAGLVKGVVGLGLPTVAIALLALLMTPAQAVALLIVPSLVTNIWQIRPWRSLPPLLKRLAPMQAGVFIGTVAGAWLLGAATGAWAMICLGAALIGYAGWGLSGARWIVPARTQTWLGPVIGTLTGVITAATGVFAVPAVPYLQAIELERDELIQAMGISFTVSTVALALGLYINDRYSTAALGISFLLLVPALIGMEIGQRLRRRLSPALFKKCFLISLALLGGHMIVYELLVR